MYKFQLVKFHIVQLKLFLKPWGYPDCVITGLWSSYADVIITNSMNNCTTWLACGQVLSSYCDAELLQLKIKHQNTKVLLKYLQSIASELVFLPRSECAEWRNLIDSKSFKVQN